MTVVASQSIIETVVAPPCLRNVERRYGNIVKAFHPIEIGDRDGYMV
tara:strand:- start:550 stop:690 length:141 start_codon:yes stop_codon:yes gene_type:complete